MKPVGAEHDTFLSSQTQIKAPVEDGEGHGYMTDHGPGPTTPIKFYLKAPDIDVCPAKTFYLPPTLHPPPPSLLAQQMTIFEETLISHVVSIGLIA